MTENGKIKRSRVLYICEASFEYLIAILVGSSYLATLTKELGINDSLTGILSSFISLGCLFQLFSMAVYRRRTKPLVVIMSVVNQLLFMLLYVIPLTPLNGGVKIAAFVLSIFLAYFTYNFVHPKKINWFMSLIDDSIRGRFTAVKEMVSLLLGMAFSFGMGAVIDHFKAEGEIRTAFVLSAAVIFVLTVLHTLTLALSAEKPLEKAGGENVVGHISSVLKDRRILRVTGAFVLYYAANYAAAPFYGTYQINELGFSLKYVSLLTVVSSLVRALASFFLGTYADRRSFASMLRVCFSALAAGYIFAAFSTPENGRWTFLAYYILYGFAMAGVNSALINLVYDYAPVEKRADSLAISQAAAGLSGFLVTLLVSPLITVIQKNGNRLFGIDIYAQQATSIISAVLITAGVLYVTFAFGKKAKAEGDNI